MRRLNVSLWASSSWLAILFAAGSLPTLAPEMAGAHDLELAPETAAVGRPTAPFAVLPEAVNSFGAAVLGDWLYVYGGHIGETHRYHAGTTTPHFRRLNLRDRSTWEDLPQGPALQGVALVAHGEKLYRVGGTSTRNKHGESEDMISVADFSSFDPRTKTWTKLPSMPSPRSTFDAVVAGDSLYVVGGWDLKGGPASNAEFIGDALRFDLSRTDGKWESLPAPPFRRRALAVAELDGKIYVLGGLTEDGDVVKTVDVYNPATRSWAQGPELPGGKLQGFSPSAFGIDGEIYVSGHDGLVHRLARAGKEWLPMAKLTVPRLTHRMVPGNRGDLLVVGGNFGGAPTRFIESIALKNPAELESKVMTWTVALPSPALQGQAVGLVQASLLAVGGNRSAEPHAFAVENLVSEGVRVSLSRLHADPIAPLPAPRQSAALVVTGNERKRDIYLLGGIGPDGSISRTLGDVFRYDLAANLWTRLTARIPDDRGMFEAATYKNSIWLFGGDTWNPRPGKTENKLATEVLRWEPGREGSTFEPTGQNLPHPRRSFAGAVLGSKFYLVGGLGANQEIVDVVDVFDFDQHAWTTISPPSSPRLFARLAVVEGKLYLAGGYVKGTKSHFETTRSIEVFDPVANTWSTLARELPVPPGIVDVLPVQNRLLFLAHAMNQSGQAHVGLLAP